MGVGVDRGDMEGMMKGMPATTNHVILVAVDIMATSRHEAMTHLMTMLQSTGTLGPNHPHAMDSWWIAEDDRTDNSDNDSAVFVALGTQDDINALLENRDNHYEDNEDDQTTED